MKGLHLYLYLDSLLSSEPYSQMFSFTYIGNLPEGIKLLNSTHIPALSQSQLADELPKHHIYLTASQCEPGGNHQVEGALSGLPLLYLSSGCMPEYCSGYGLPFTGISDFSEALFGLINNYQLYRSRVLSYPFDSELMCKKYLKLLKVLSNKKSPSLRSKYLQHPLCLLSSFTVF